MKLAQGMLFWIKTWPPWVRLNKPVHEHPCLVLHVKGEEALLAICNSDSMALVTVPIVKAKHPSAFTPDGILAHASCVNIVSRTGPSVYWVKVVPRGLLFASTDGKRETVVTIRNVKKMEPEQFRDLLHSVAAAAKAAEAKGHKVVF